MDWPALSLQASATARPQLQGKYDRRLTGAGNIDEQLQKVTFASTHQLWGIL